VGAAKLEAGLLAVGLAMTVFAVKTAGDFDTSFREISTIIDASGGDLDGFKKAIDEYAAGSTQSMAQITAALGAAIGSGIKWSESLDLIATAEKLAVATRSDLDSTTKVLVSTLNSYGLTVKDAGDVSDLFFSIIDKGDIKMVDLANSFAKVAPVAKIAGVSLDEVGAAVATLTASGIKPAESFEYLRGAISNIISPSGQAKDLAAELGLNFNAAGLKADGLAGLLTKVTLATSGSADKMKILFGDIGGFTAAATLAGPQAAVFAQTLIEMADRSGKTATAFDIMKLSMESSSKVIGNSFEYLLRQIGTPLLDEFGGIANAIAGIFKALGTSVKDGALNDLLEYIET
jgi:TP901 family phage tail tape measure protein